METQPAIEIFDLHAYLAAGGSGVAFARETDDLDVNLIRFEDGAGVERHVNREVDTLLVVVAGEGIIRSVGTEYRLATGQAVLIPKGVDRSIRSLPGGSLAYLSIHRRRRRLLPEVPHRA